MIFETERLIIRQWSPDDADDAFAIYSDPLVTRNLGNAAPHADLAFTRAWIDRLIARNAKPPGNLGLWAAQHRETGRVIGAALLNSLPETPWVEVGYHIGQALWGQGYATEIGRGCLRHGFTVVGLPRIIAIVMPENAASRHVIEKLGLHPEGRWDYRGMAFDAFALDAAEWTAAQSAAGGLMPREGASRCWWRAAVLVTAWSYVALVASWAVVHRLYGDRWWWLFALNSLALYLFAPLPLVALVAGVARQRAVWLGLAVVALIGAFTYGGLWVPHARRAGPPGPQLTVMTFNTLGLNHCPDCVVATIRAADADLVTLQELAPATAAAIDRDLAREYPYRILDPRPGVEGMGTISRLPLRATGEHLHEGFVGTPQVLALDLAGMTVTVVNAHPVATWPGRPADMESSVRTREAQAGFLADFVRAHPGPLILPIDANTTDQNRAYAILTGPLRDSWREVGWGFGHTYPGHAPSGEGGYTIGPLTLPNWLVRIDYVFHSPHWQALSARVGPWDGASDHRPVVVRLALLSPR